MVSGGSRWAAWHWLHATGLQLWLLNRVAAVLGERSLGGHLWRALRIVGTE